MCKHNDQDEPCDDCCFWAGFEAAKDAEPDEPHYKNWSQVNAFHDGYANYMARWMKAESN